MGKTVRVENDLTIFNVAELREILLSRIQDGGGDLEIDLSAATAVDDTGFQLLLATSKSAARANRGLRVSNAPAALREYVAVADLRDEIRIEYKGE